MTDDMHTLIRTSPIGDAFVGTCTKCGLDKLSFKDMNNPCENSRGVSQGASLLEAIDPKGKSS